MDITDKLQDLKDELTTDPDKAEAIARDKGKTEEEIAAKRKQAEGAKNGEEAGFGAGLGM